MAKRKLDCELAIAKIKSVFRKKPKCEIKSGPSANDFCPSSKYNSQTGCGSGSGAGALWPDCGSQNSVDTDSSPECLDHTVPLTCPITRQLMRYPARGEQCDHIQCFDLESYLRANSDRLTWKCPICKQQALIEHVIVDEYLENIIRDVKEFVLIMSFCEIKKICQHLFVTAPT